MSLDDLVRQAMMTDDSAAIRAIPNHSGSAGVFIAGTEPETGLPIIVHQIFDTGTHNPPITSLLFPVSDPEGEIPLELPIQEDLQRERDSLAYLMGVLRGLYQRCVAYEKQMATLHTTLSSSGGVIVTEEPPTNT